MVKILNKDSLHFWIQQSIGTANFTLTIENTTQKGEGYVGELVFVKIDLQQPINGKDFLHLVIKTNIKNLRLEKSPPVVQELCKREVYFYSTILKEYQQLQLGKKLHVPFDMVPKCYKTFLEDGNAVIILENLKKDGYVLHPRDQPMNIAHLQMGLRSYAKLHALSFALKDQKKETFEKISKTLKTLKETGRPDLSVVYEKFINEKSIFNRFMEICDTIPKDQAIIHADYHNANMLFKYKDNDRTVPIHKALLDFQGAAFQSPVIDLSYFLYINLSPSDFPKLKEFVEYYYTEFCLFLKELGSDADKLFPRSIFEEHLKIYLPYGGILSLPFLEILYLENDETPALVDEENEFFGSLIKEVEIKSRDQYLQRLRSIGTGNFTFTVENTTQKGEGYIGELFFVKIDLQQPINEKEVLYLVIKTNKKNPGSEKSISIVQDLCKREVYFYSTILKEYQDFQKNKKLPVLFDMVPKCYKTFSEIDNEVVILENLKEEGYMLHPREQPMNIAHLEMGLRSYAKLHAMSFALKDQKNDIFENISKTCTPLLNEMFLNFKKLFDTKTRILVETLKEAGRPDLSMVYENYINDKSIYTRFIEVTNAISKDLALIHADSHNGNMMFQY
ncbi:unnamed protein product [Diabrotica balteata]|uniref:CHK kinase-like domain-containing protein n=1 Tax=Diabrotica balteata TaxID=107213 RepID=A0A9N9TD47_DIABA|nr:unnamed protein product [Diabrotica balteata]